MRIDSAGRLLINHSSNIAPDGYASKLQLCDTSYEGSSVVPVRTKVMVQVRLLFSQNHDRQAKAETQ